MTEIQKAKALNERNQILYMLTNEAEKELEKENCIIYTILSDCLNDDTPRKLLNDAINKANTNTNETIVILFTEWYRLSQNRLPMICSCLETIIRNRPQNLIVIVSGQAISQ